MMSESEFIEFPMFKGTDTRQVVQLKDIVSIIPENEWVWRILWFDGRGNLPGDMNWVDFQNSLKVEGGLSVDWDFIISISNSILQTNDCLLIALDDEQNSPKLNSTLDIRAVVFPNTLIAIEAFDSTTWIIRASAKSKIDTTDFVRRFT